MKSQFQNSNNDRTPLIAAAGLGLVLLAMGGCGGVHIVHAPPGTSVNVVLAKKAEPVPTPTPVPARVSARVQAAEELPSSQDALTENIADYYTLGNLMMGQQKYPEAIKAFESALKLDPTFSDAWNHLAICYQNVGETKKAAEAFKKYKAVAQQQPQQVSPPQ